MRIAFLGRTHILMKAIELIENSEHEIAGIGTCRAEAEYLIDEKIFEEKARQLNVPFFCNTQINTRKIQTILREMKADIAISINWLTLINSETISIFRYGILNGHAGDLPRYRGNACPNWAIINDEREIGVTVHFMEESKLDSGDIVVKKYVPITDNTTIGDLYKKIEELLPEMFLNAVSKIEKLGDGARIPQNKAPDAALRCYPRMKSDSYIDWNKSCAEIDRLIRASGYPFQGAYTYLNGREKVYIYKAVIRKYEVPSVAALGQVVFRDCKEREIGIAAKDGIIVVQKAGTEKKGEIDITEIVKSARDRMGMFVPDQIYELQNEMKKLKDRVEELEKRGEKSR